MRRKLTAIGLSLLVTVGLAAGGPNSTIPIDDFNDGDADGWDLNDFTGLGINHVEAGYPSEGTYEGTLKVEVRKPVAAQSDPVTYTITCEDVPPADGGTEGGGGTYTPGVEQSALMRRR